MSLNLVVYGFLVYFSLKTLCFKIANTVLLSDRMTIINKLEDTILYHQQEPMPFLKVHVYYRYLKYMYTCG